MIMSISLVMTEDSLNEQDARWHDMRAIDVSYEYLWFDDFDGLDEMNFGAGGFGDV